MTHRGVLILLIFVLIVGAFIGGWFYVWEKKSEMAPVETKTESRIVTTSSRKDWKVYKNEKYGYKVKYPDLATLKIVPEDNLEGRSKVVNSFPPNHPHIVIELINAFIAFRQECGPLGIGDGARFKNKVELDAKSFEVFGFVTGSSRIACIDLPHIDVEYGFGDYVSDLSLHAEEIREAEQFINEILGTFEFIE